jgi:HEAT repeat protein
MSRGIRQAPRARAAVRLAAWLASAALLPACESCSDRDERRIAHLVDLVLTEPGPTSDAAEEALIASGRAAILYVETGLYDADPAGRRRLVRVLTRIGDREASPILAHLAERDPDPEVRGDAAAGARALERPPLP